jgi:hypothetical protein
MQNNTPGRQTHFTSNFQCRHGLRRPAPSLQEVNFASGVYGFNLTSADFSKQRSLQAMLRVNTRDESDDLTT